MQQKARKKKRCFNAHFQNCQPKNMGLIKMYSLKSLAMLNCESRTSLHVVEYKLQLGFILMFFCYY